MCEKILFFTHFSKMSEKSIFFTHFTFFRAFSKNKEFLVLIILRTPIATDCQHVSEKIKLQTTL
jgi:hypothetical protein